MRNKMETKKSYTSSIKTCSALLFSFLEGIINTIRIVISNNNKIFVKNT